MMPSRSHRRVAALLTTAMLLAACSGEPAAPASAPTGAPAAAATPMAITAHSITVAPQPTAPPAPTPTIAAPTAAPPTAAPTAALAAANGPQFSHPADITNPFYPIALTNKAVALGQEGGQPARNEVTLLPGTKTITWQGQSIEARVTQFLAYADNKLVEVAYDYFAQADDGSVYYLGEDVSNYEDGKLIDHGGSWLTGKDGAPPALIMPAHPQIGQVFNPENLPGVVYETDEILSLSEQTITPAGPTDKGMLVKETLMDGSIEHKVYAADFGIVEDRADDELLTLALFLRAGAQPGTVPQPLTTIEAQAEDIIDSAPAGNWPQVGADVGAIVQASQQYGSQAAADHVPKQFLDTLTAATSRLQKASAAKQKDRTLQAANDVSAAVVDLFMVYQPALPSDLGLLDVLERQALLDAAAADDAGAADSLAKLGAVWARVKPIVLGQNGAADVAARFDSSLATQQQALSSANVASVAAEAKNALELVDQLENLF